MWLYLILFLDYHKGGDRDIGQGETPVSANQLEDCAGIPPTRQVRSLHEYLIVTPVLSKRDNNAITDKYHRYFLTVWV